MSERPAWKAWRSVPWAHYFPVGEDAVLFDERRQELHRLNSSALALWNRLDQRDDHQAAAAQPGSHDDCTSAACADLLKRWNELGLIIDAELRPQLSAISPRRRSRLRRSICTASWQTQGFGRNYRVLTSNCRVEVPSLAEAECVDAALAHAAVDEGGATNLVLTVTRERSGAYQLAIGGEFLDRCDDLLGLAPLVKSWLAILASGQTPHMLGLHAAALAIDGASIVIAAPSGSGKTTLALAGMRAGFDYLADDIVLLCQEDEAIIPLRSSLCIKESGLRLAKHFEPRVTSLRLHRRCDGLSVRYLPPAPLRQAPAPVRWPVSAFFFPIRSHGETCVRRLAPIEVLHRLLKNCCSVASTLSARDVALLTRLASSRPGYEAEVVDPVEAIARLLECYSELASFEQIEGSTSPGALPCR